MSNPHDLLFLASSPSFPESVLSECFYLLSFRLILARLIYRNSPDLTPKKKWDWIWCGLCFQFMRERGY